MKKTLKILTTTTASTLLVSLTTGCGREEHNKIHSTENDNENMKIISKEESSEIKLSIKSNEGSLDSLRCIGSGRCVLQDR
jgi:siroheme synthase (precorrin-2 oxidase/ferrochelatase)